MTVKVAVFQKAKEFPHEVSVRNEYTYTFLPRVGDYIQIPHNLYVGYEVVEVTLLEKNYRELDAIVVVAFNGKVKTAQLYDFYELKRKEEKAEKEFETRRQKRIQARKKNLEEPDATYQRYKMIYERRKNGEKDTDLALEMNISTARIRQLAKNWEILLRWGEENEQS